MQDAGIHVIFGVEGLKIHSKLLHIGTRHGDIACISTGNFHEGNARMYTDYTIMTAHRPIVREVNAVFDFVEKLYEASTAGVQVELVVRGNCSLVTGVPGISENIHINGIIDRYLEHSRIFIFANGGEEKYYIGSADWMPRNLDNRIEVAAPVYDKEIQADLKRIVCYGFRDTAKGRIVDGTGENREKEREENSVPFRSQEKLYNEYKNTL